MLPRKRRRTTVTRLHPSFRLWRTVRVRDIAVVAQGPKIRLGQFGRSIHRADGRIIDNDDVASGIVLMRKGAPFDETIGA